MSENSSEYRETLAAEVMRTRRVHAFGPDPLVPRCRGSMTCIIEPV